MRWKAFLPTVLVVALAAALTRLFLDEMVERAVESVGSKINGAKVELDDVDISLLRLDVAFKRLQVADEHNPMTNAVEVDALRFGLDAKPLTWKKIIIENAEIAGIRTGTPRKTSGALPKKEKKKDEKTGPSALDKGKELAGAALGNLKDQYDPRKLKPEDLASYRKIKEEQERLPALAQEWESRVEALKAEEKAREAQAFFERVKTEKYSGLEGLQKAKQDLEQGRKIKDELQQAQKDFAALKSDIGGQMAQAKNTIQEIEKLRRQDVDNALGGLKNAFSVEGIAQGVIGPVWFGKIQTALGWFHKARRLIPQKKEDAAPPPPPRTGRDIHFPFKHNWPAFHLRRAAVSGTTSGENPLGYEGTLKDVSSDPKKVGRPVALDVQGRRGAEALMFRGELDYTGETPREKVSLRYEGLALAGKKLGDVAGPISVRDGVGTVSADLEARGPSLQGKIEFVAAPVNLNHELSPEQAADKLYGLLHQTLQKITRLDATFAVSGDLESPDISLRSSLDKQIGDAVKQAVQKELDEVRARVSARVEELTAAEKKKLTDLVNARTGGVAEKLGKKDQSLSSAQSQLDKALDDLKSKGRESLPLPSSGSSDDKKPASPDLKDIFKKR
ncbi:MAG: TIGR03545 family protein [Elusimicrobiota bacterium]